MKPIAIQMAMSSTASYRCRNASTARTSDAAPLMNSNTRPLAATGRLKAKITCSMPVSSR
jgi:hypothetical protein